MNVGALTRSGMNTVTTASKGIINDLDFNNKVSHNTKTFPMMSGLMCVVLYNCTPPLCWCVGVFSTFYGENKPGMCRGRGLSGRGFSTGGQGRVIAVAGRGQFLN